MREPKDRSQERERDCRRDQDRNELHHRRALLDARGRMGRRLRDLSRRAGPEKARGGTAGLSPDSVRRDRTLPHLESRRQMEIEENAILGKRSALDASQ
jgi:hypothetical protein